MQQRQFPFHHAVFTPPDSQYGKLKAAAVSGARDVSWQHTLCQAWKTQVPRHPQVTYTPASSLPVCNMGSLSVLTKCLWSEAAGGIMVC